MFKIFAASYKVERDGNRHRPLCASVVPTIIRVTGNRNSFKFSRNLGKYSVTAKGYIIEK
jgi:hypothetical protein